MSQKPNIVLICADQYRGDCLGLGGHPTVQAPFLDQLAYKGARFQRAYSATPTCIPARAALYTGLSQPSHGRVGYQDGVPWDYPVTIAGEFTRHGYQTQAIGKMHVYPERSQMGFQNVILHDGYLHHSRHHSKDLEIIDDYVSWLREHYRHDADYFDHGINCNSLAVRPWDKPEHLHPVNFVATKGVEFLRRRDPRKPFFLFLSFVQPHPPYSPPGWTLEQYLNQSMPDVPVGDWTEIWQGWAEPNRADCYVGEIDKQALHRARAGYYGAITHLDHQINRFVETLGQFGLSYETYICFTSDHGEMLGDHHMFRKGYPYEGSARIPLILKGPPNSGIVGNSACEQVCELRDVMPTLLDCASLPIPDCVEGQSLLPAACGREVRLREYLHGEHSFFEFGQPLSIQWITDGREKYIWFSNTGREQLFNLDEDDLDDDQKMSPEVGPALSPAVAKALNAAVHMIGHTFIREHTYKKKIKRGKKTRTKEVTEVQYCLRIGPDPLYITKLRKPKSVQVPSVIVDPSYQDIMDIVKDNG